MDSENANELGSIRIADDAIAVIAGMAALEIQGIAAMAQGRVDGFAEVLGLKPPQGRGVKVDVTSDEVTIELNLLVDFGVDIPAVCQRVQDKVREAVEDMTGLSVAQVHVSVQGVKRKAEKALKPGN
jgi:uncharacterized alkaline shock family protein YloU